MKWYNYLIFLCVLSFQILKAQPANDVQRLGDNWYLQVGMDMSLQNPYGHDFSKVFPNGKSFGVDVALGRWFTPEIGLRGKFNWENGISLLENGHAIWLAPFDEPGKNMEKGGYMTIVGDIPIDIHNLLLGYDPQRMWNMQIYPRAGMAYNFGVEKGTPLLGFGIGNTFRLNDRLSIYLDAAYQGVSSGFTGVEKSTGVGSNSNGFVDLNVGVQFNLGRTKYSYFAGNKNVPQDNSSAWDNGFWKNWFLQFGLDMTLQNPYQSNFSKVFPKGKSFGIDAAIGKWFSPEIGVRGRLNWENGLPFFENGHLEWIATDSKSDHSNMEDGGYVAVYMDILLDVNNLLCGFDPQRRGHFVVFPRAGLASNLAISSTSPMVGVGCGYTYRLSDRFGLYADMAYQMTTSEFFSGVSGTGMSVSKGSNGFLDFHVGVQMNLGK